MYVRAYQTSAVDRFDNSKMVHGYRAVIVLMILIHVGFIEGGQTCLSCSNVENIHDCQHFVTCSNNEVCFKQKYTTESGSLTYDLGCAIPDICNHLIGSIFGRRSEGHRLQCYVCCNNTRYCNQDLSCTPVTVDNTHKPRECAEIQVKNAKSGVYTIYPDGKISVPVYCEMINDTLKWTVIQKRFNGFVNFYRGWEAYKEGFGNTSSEYWLGNENIHDITTHGNHKLRIVLSDFDGDTRYAEYRAFDVGDEDSGYQLLVLGYSGDAGDSLAIHNGMRFTTFDRDNDKATDRNCAASYSGAWWYSACHHSNLNGKYLAGHHDSLGVGMNWYHWHKYFYSLKTSTMMITKS